MADGIRTGDPRGFNKGRSSKFREGSRVRQTPEEGRRTYRLKRCGNNNKDEDNSLKNNNDKNQQVSSQNNTSNLKSAFNLVFVRSFSLINNSYEKIIVSLVSLFNGIPTFVGYLMPKPFSWKNSSGTI